MSDRIIKTIPEHMVVLSLLPPPHAFEPLRPFGFGAFVIARHSQIEARFSLHAQGYAAGYKPQRIRSDIRSLFTPETKSLIYIPAMREIREQRTATAKHPSTFLDLVPRAGLRSNVLAALPHDILAHSAGVAGLNLPRADPSPLQRVGRLGIEAQAAWVYWLIKSCSPNLRRRLLAGHAAWQAIERARQVTAQVDH